MNRLIGLTSRYMLGPLPKVGEVVFLLWMLRGDAPVIFKDELAGKGVCACTGCACMSSPICVCESYFMAHVIKT